MMIVVLPTFKEYTVDERLKEFRKIVHGKVLVFILFNSIKGQELLAEMKNGILPIGRAIIFCISSHLCILLHKRYSPAIIITLTNLF